MSKTNGEPDSANGPGKRALAGLRWALVGPGRVGTSLAWWLDAHGAELVRIGSRRSAAHLLPTPARSDPSEHPSATSSAAVSSSVQQTTVEELDSHDLDLLLLAVSDPALEAVAGALAQRPQAPVVLHVSGHFDAEILAPLRRSAVGSLHPLRAFAAPSFAADEARGTVFAIDGDPPALDLARRITNALGAQAFEIDGPRRLAYHLAASLAAGGVMTVLAAAEELLDAAELPRELLAAYLDLAHGAIDRVPADAPERAVASAITGPMARGDRPVLARQRAVLADLAPVLVPLFDRLASENHRLRRGSRASSADPPRRPAGGGHPEKSE